MLKQPDKKNWDEFVEETNALFKKIAIIGLLLASIALMGYALYTLGIFHEIP